jgi:hypothetical protein
MSTECAEESMKEAGTVMGNITVPEAVHVPNKGDEGDVAVEFGDGIDVLLALAELLIEL